MDISEKCYQKITPRQRAIAVYNALNRKDRAEIDRLIKNAPKDGNHRQAILAIGQAKNVYNQFMAKVIKDFFVVHGELMEALSFCVGWDTAGGAIDNKVSWFSGNRTFELFMINHHERRKVHAKETS